MPRMRPLKKEEDIARVPPDRPVLIETAEDPPESVEVEVTTGDKETVTPEPKIREPEQETEREEEREPDAATALTKQLEDLKKAEATVRQQLAQERSRREAAEREAADRRQDAVRSRDDEVQARLDAITNSIGAQQERVEAAKRDLRSAMTTQDWDLHADATDRLAESRSYLAHLETSKAEVESRREQMKTEAERATVAVNNTGDPIDRLPNLSMQQRDWLKSHRDAFDNKTKNLFLGAVHSQALDNGLRVDSQEYFDFLETELGYRQRPQPRVETRERELDDEPRRAIVSAPVSREVPSAETGRRSSTRVELLPEQREAAKLAGISETEYAKQVIKMRDMKKNGFYKD